MRSPLKAWIGVLAIFLATATFGEAAQVLLADDFNDNSLDPSKWFTVLPNIPGSPSVTEQNQRIELLDGGYLVSQNQFDPSVVGPLTITGVWTFNSASIAFQQEDVMTIFTRSNAIPDGPPYGGISSGVGFNLNMRQDNPGGVGINYRLEGGQYVNLASAPIGIRNGESFQFTIQDDGTTVSFAVQKIGGDGASATITASVPNQFNTNYIVFGNGARGGNPVPHVSYLDDIAVTTPVPEPSSLTLLGIASASMLGYNWRRRKATA